ncbi:hypothetical protein BD414DRAFT_478381 [Trametes punicea]|nr:hypothetical protein BD414DRAFT_478381 [Trametes punicea]
MGRRACSNPINCPRRNPSTRGGGDRRATSLPAQSSSRTYRVACAACVRSAKSPELLKVNAPASEPPLSLPHRDSLARLMLYVYGRYPVCEPQSGTSYASRAERQHWQANMQARATSDSARTPAVAVI